MVVRDRDENGPVEYDETWHTDRETLEVVDFTAPTRATPLPILLLRSVRPRRRGAGRPRGGARARRSSTSRDDGPGEAAGDSDPPPSRRLTSEEDAARDGAMAGAIPSANGKRPEARR